MNTAWERWTDGDVVDLVRAYPLAIVVSKGAEFAATPLPILIETDASGKPVSLLGHISRFNPQTKQLQADPRALFLFTGPHAYLSPSLVADRSWGPTWNYALVKITADVSFDEKLLDEALAALIAHMEKGRRQPWTAAELGPRYEELKKRIIAFRAPIARVEARFKLGQDEKPDVLSQLLAGSGDDALASWMTRFNAGRV